MEQRNLVLAIVASLAILLTFQYFVLETPPPVEQQTVEQGDETVPSGPAPRGAPTPGREAGEALPEAAPEEMRAEALEKAPRVQIRTPVLKGSISLVGGRVDDLILSKYRTTLDENSDPIVLLSPETAPKPYFADFGWSSSDQDLALPGPETVWRADRETLGPDTPVTLTWDNGQGLRFERIYEIDRDYMFTVTQRVFNETDAAVALSPYGFIRRIGTPPVLGFYILHEGLIGVFDNELNEIDYDDEDILYDGQQNRGWQRNGTTGAWLGITDKYWLVALIPDGAAPTDTRFLHDPRGGQNRYQADFLYQAASVPAGGSKETKSRLFAGAKRVPLLASYRDELGIALFDRAVDFGWLWFLTKPLFYALHEITKFLGNFGVAILVLTVFIKILFFPLANKSYRSMAKMRKLQPEMLRLRERFGDDKQRLNQEMMGLYKREGANPMSGCLPIVIQIPVFFALYKVMFVTIEMRHAPFFGWIQDLSAPDPTSILNGFGLLPWVLPNLGPLEVLNIGVWPLVMGLTMFLQQRLNPQPPDPIQAKIFLFMPIIFTFLLAQFPAGLVIYWTWNNMLSILQQYVIMRRAGVPVGGKAGAT